MSNEWKTIDTAPNDGTGFMSGWKDEIGNFHYAIAYMSDFGWRIARTNSVCFPTHWMPLPKPPTKENN